MAENLLTVAALRGTLEAELIRNKLESEGISAVLLEPEKGPDGAPTARVQVQVSPADFERAMQLLFPIPKLKRPAKERKPSWKCPKCGEQVLGQFPVCWKCGTSREGQPTAALAQPPLPSTSRIAPAAAAPPPEVEIRPVPMRPLAASTSVKPNVNGAAAAKPAALPSLRPRTSEDETLKIVVPAWDPAMGRGRGAGGETSDDAAKRVGAADRAARRAWYTAVFGIVIWPLLIYSMWVVLVLGLTNRPMSRRGNRFFFGALAVNAAIIAAFFIWFGRQE